MNFSTDVMRRVSRSDLVLALGSGFAAAAGALFGSALGMHAAITLALSCVSALLVSALVLSIFPSAAPAKSSRTGTPSAFERFCDEVSSAASPADVARAIEDAVIACIRCQRAELSLENCAFFRYESGSHRIADCAPQGRTATVNVEVALRGLKFGRLTAERGAGGAAFTADDVSMLRSIARQGALALAQVVASAELGRRGELQAAAWRDEREALVETLSAEIAHEVRYPINFFRSIFQRASQSRLLDDDDIEIGAEEVERLERLCSGLRRMASPHLERRVVDLADLCGRAEALLRDRMHAGHFSVDLTEGVALRCDSDKITQVLVNLLANALEATGGRGEVGIEWRPSDGGGVLDVWDNGPGFGADPSRLFTAGHTTKPRGTGLGLAITYRLVRAHGWTVEASRSDARTRFSLTVPQGDIVGASGKHRVASPAAARDEGPLRLLTKSDRVA